MGIDFFLKVFSEISGLILMLIILLFLIYWMEKRDVNRLNRKKEKFFNIVRQELKANRLETLVQTKRIYSSVVNTYYYHLENWLKELLYELDINQNNEKYFLILEKILEDIEFEDPFDGLPDQEREILKTFKTFNINKDKVFEDRLYRLSDIIKARYAEKTKSDKWLRRLEITSFILTVYGLIKSF